MHAVAGIGNPNAFFNTLKKEKLDIEPHVFPDHHIFKTSDLNWDETQTIIMTEKDAVKCQRFAAKNMWYLPIDAKLTKDFEMQLINKIEK